MEEACKRCVKLCVGGGGGVEVHSNQLKNMVKVHKATISNVREGRGGA